MLALKRKHKAKLFPCSRGRNYIKSQVECRIIFTMRKIAIYNYKHVLTAENWRGQVDTPVWNTIGEGWKYKHKVIEMNL